MILSKITKILNILVNQPNKFLPITLSYFLPQILNYKFNKNFGKLNLKKNYFILSLDCDTIEDLKYIPSLHDKLNQLNISPTYAVPGELLLKDVDLFKNLKMKGAEFINHGYKLHTHYNTDNKTYVSTHFYNDYTESQIEDDIKKGHDTITNLFSEKPMGFRTPHFGTIRSIKKKNLINKILENLDYKFSSSATPIDSFFNLPIYKYRNGITEFPLTGSFDRPHIILDSWNFIYAKKRYFNKSDYIKQIIKIKEYFNAKKTNILINIYVDPSHLVDWNDFFESIILLQDFKNINYSDILKLIR